MALHIVQFRGLRDLWVVQVLNQYWGLVLYLREIMWILAVILNIVGKRAHIQILMCHPLVILCSFSCHFLYFAQRAWNSTIAIFVAIALVSFPILVAIAVAVLVATVIMVVERDQRYETDYWMKMDAICYWVTFVTRVSIMCYASTV